MSTAPTITVAGNNVLPYLQERSMSVKMESVDFTLVDQAYTPQLGDAVVMTWPTWAGEVIAIESTGYKGNVPFVKVRATNRTELPNPGAAPFNLSDTPNLTTTFGFRDLVIMRTVSDSGANELRAKCKVFQEGLTVGMEIDLTSVVEGFASDTFTIMELTTEWPVKAGATYSLDLGFGDNATAKAGKLYPITLKDEISKAARHEITVDNGGIVDTLVTGTLEYWEYRHVPLGTTGSLWHATPGLNHTGTWLDDLVGWPDCPCGGVGLGGSQYPGKRLLGLCALLPADDDYIVVKVECTLTGIDHGVNGAFVGSVDAQHGPINVVGPLVNRYPTAASAENIDTTTGTPSAGALLAVLDADVAATATWYVPAANLDWGNGFHMIAYPAWELDSGFVCHAEMLAGAINNGGLVISSAVLTFMKLSDRAYGWIETEPRGTRDGVNQSFTLLGGYDDVSDIWVNGLPVPPVDWVANDGTTLELFWAPLATDTITVRYYIPR